MHEDSLQKLQARTISLLQQELIDVFGPRLSEDGKETLTQLIEHIVLIAFYEYGIPASKHIKNEDTIEIPATV